MPKKSLKKKAEPKYDPKQILCHPSTWIAVVLALALLIVYGVSMYGFKNVQPKTELETAKLEMFDHLISEVMYNQKISDEKPTIKEVTGYGISDEDGVFYVTFDFAPYELDENKTPKYDGLKHGIMYFWKDRDHGTYSRAFSYHDDYYHPGGVYKEIGEHRLREQFEE